MVARPTIEMSDEELKLRVTKSPIMTNGDVASKRAEIKEYFNNTFTIFEKLYETLACEEAFQMKPLHGLRHPHIFYYGHTATFFINKLALGGYLDRINPLYEESFAIGVDEMQWDDLSETHYDFPPSSEVTNYRNQVRERLNKYIDEVQFTVPITWESPMFPILMGIEHERIHLETSAVLIRELPLNMVKQTPFWKPCPHQSDAAPENELIEVAPGAVHVGRPRSGPIFGWDVDCGTQNFEIEGFKASKYVVSNAEYLTFMKDGGYENEELWTEEGQGWKKFRSATMPHFWVKNGDSYKLRTLTEEIDMPLSWPCEVNNHEAKAFCNWKGTKLGQHVRLPTEAEWSLLFDRNVKEDHWEWKEAPGNTNLEKFTSTCPVNMFQQGDFYDVVGNVWQHTETPTGPLPEFEVHPLYDDFSMPTFDGDHAIQKGGCWIATGTAASRDARFAFRRHFYQFIGIRYLVAEPCNEYAGFYANDPVVDQYTEFHYGPKPEGDKTKGFPVEIANFATEAFKKYGKKGDTPTLAADIGCRSGRSSFELARFFSEVQGIDFSARFIMPGCQMRECQQTKWTAPTEGDLVVDRHIKASDVDVDQLIHTTTFWQSDPANLHAHLKGYDLVLVNINLLERVYQPISFLKELKNRMNEKSVLVFASTFDWKNGSTQKQNWLGGYLDEEGKPVKSFDALKATLSDDFDFKEASSLPFSLPIREGEFLTGNCPVGVWIRK
eukprot:TRINITY_DN2832_c0_g1_i1.p1 TRINITY_DN2832_c0_g1~~TRINITY_DN2832_c0_g1_i1.p1  ORF type:complete len:749 (+),score=176.12 TRINITY_DN2832_c0_g1_i1:80-2248(+)